MEIEEDDALNLRIYSLKKLNIEISRLFFFWNEVNLEGKYGVEKFRRFGSILTLLIMGKVLISLKAIHPASESINTVCVYFVNASIRSQIEFLSKILKNLDK